MVSPGEGREHYGAALREVPVCRAGHQVFRRHRHCFCNLPNPMEMKTMQVRSRMVQSAVAVGTAALLSACSQVGSLGGVLGSVLTPQPMQVSATVRTVDTRNQQISLEQSDGQSVAVTYDNQTKVLYQNQVYPVTSLEFGDQVRARVVDRGNNVYYTDSVFVTQPVNNTPGTSTGGTTTVNSQLLQGTVRQIDRSNGSFTLDAGNNNLTVTMPYRASSSDLNKFQGLQIGDYVRLYGVFLNNTRVELQRFY
jgi:hypothetical protein